MPYKFHIRQTTQTPATQPSTQRAVHWLAAVKSSTCLRPSSARAKKVFARHKHPNLMGFSHEMEKTKGGIVWVPKEFKVRQ